MSKSQSLYPNAFCDWIGDSTPANSGIWLVIRIEKISYVVILTPSMDHFNFYNKFNVAITGTGSTYENFRNYYAEFKTSTMSPTEDIHCNFSNDFLEPEQMLGGGRKWFGRHKGFFLVTIGGCQMRISPDWRQFQVHNDFPSTKFRILLEGELRHHVGNSGMVMLHGSGVKYRGNSMIFPAWRHTGKTNTMLSFILKGASYFADDRLFVDRDSVWGFPVPINILYYNLTAFPDLLEQKKSDLIRNAIHKRIISLTNYSTSDPAKAIRIASNALIQSGRSASLSDLQIEPEPTSQDRSRIDMIGMLETICGQHNIIINELSSDRFQSSMAAISYTEWDAFLQEVYMAFDQLFPEDETKLAQLENLHETEAIVLKDLYENTGKSIQIGIPREYDWSENSISTELAKELSHIENSKRCLDK